MSKTKSSVNTKTLSLFCSLSLFILLRGCEAWNTSPKWNSRQIISYNRKQTPCKYRSTSALNVSTKPKTEEESIEATTEKYGLEAGLFESLKKEDGGESAKSLLKKYGVAYLATSIPLAIVSFAICYFLVDAGVDVQGLLMKIGIGSDSANSDAAEKAGTVAIAYAAHKAASPIRFPPTVLLTPVVAKMIGKEPEAEVEAE